jgi:hypothetical protein
MKRIEIIGNKSIEEDVLEIFKKKEIAKYYKKNENELEQQYTRYNIVKTFISIKCNNILSYRHLFIVNDWNLRDKIKKTLNLPKTYEFISLKHIYNYVDVFLNNAIITVIENQELDENGIINYFEKDYMSDMTIHL